MVRRNSDLAADPTYRSGQNQQPGTSRRERTHRRPALPVRLTARGTERPPGHRRRHSRKQSVGSGRRDRRADRGSRQHQQGEIRSASSITRKNITTGSSSTIPGTTRDSNKDAVPAPTPGIRAAGAPNVNGQNGSTSRFGTASGTVVARRSSEIRTGPNSPSSPGFGESLRPAILHRKSSNSRQEPAAQRTADSPFGFAQGRLGGCPHII